MRKWIAAVSAVAVLACCAQVARGQCSGYSITNTGVNLLSPSDAAKQGAVTATMTVQAETLQQVILNGAVPSHSLSMTQGTYARLSVLSNHGVSARLSYSVNGGPWIDDGAVALSGVIGYTGGGSVGDVERLRFVVTDPNGNTSQDIVSVSKVAGTGPSFTNQDGVWTNAYYQLVTKFAGGSMMNSCNECQLHPNMCINKTHTPLFDATLTNPASGETQTISNASAGNVVSENQSLSGSSSIMISVLPGDAPSGSTTDKVYCTMFGWIMAQQWNPGIPDVEMAVTAEEIIPSSCTLVLRFFQNVDDWGIQCNVAWKKPPATADRCSAVSQVPDFNPGAIWDEQNCKTPGNCGTSDMPPPNGTNASYPKYWYTSSWGVRFPPGAPSPDPPILNGGAHNWLFPIYIADGYVPGGPNEDWWILDLLNLAIPKGTGLPIDCTYRDHGTSPIPNPF